MIVEKYEFSILEKPTANETEEICDYDKKACHRPRKEFLSLWLQRDDARVLV